MLALFKFLVLSVIRNVYLMFIVFINIGCRYVIRKVGLVFLTDHLFCILLQ